MTKTVFARAEAAACRAVALFEGPESTFYVKGDATAGTLEIALLVNSNWDWEHIVHVKEDGLSRVTRGPHLLFSSLDPIEAVLETVALLIAERTKSVLREVFESEGLLDA